MDNTAAANAAQHAEFLAANLDQLGHPFVIAQLVEAERNRFAPIEAAHLAYLRDTHAFLAQLHRDWVVSKQGITVDGATEPDGQAKRAEPPSPEAFIAAQLAKLKQ